MKTYMVQIDPDGSLFDPAQDEDALGVYAANPGEAAAIGLATRQWPGEHFVHVAMPGPCPKAVHSFRASWLAKLDEGVNITAGSHETDPDELCGDYERCAGPVDAK